jgi:plastocyanin
MRRFAAIAAVAGMLVLLGTAAVPAGASAPKSLQPRRSASTSVQTVAIIAFTFHPSAFTVRPDEPIKVVNLDWSLIHEEHTFTQIGPWFNTGVITSTPAVVMAPVKPGTYTFRCVIHPFMVGTVTVAKP